MKYTSSFHGGFSIAMLVFRGGIENDYGRFGPLIRASQPETSLAATPPDN